MLASALVALDLSPAERPLLDCLAHLRSLGVQRLVLLHVRRTGYIQPPLVDEAGYRAWLEHCAAPLRDAGMAVETQLEASAEPAHAILDAVKACDAELIVIGSRSRNLLQQIFLGSVARAVLQAADRPVLLQSIAAGADQTAARCAVACGDFLRNALLATDLSPAVAAAEALALALGNHAERIDVMGVSDGDGIALPELESVAGRLRAAGCRSEASLVDGSPPEAIAARAEARSSSLILVGKRGRGAAAGLLLGSTAERLCERAGRPVLMVPG
jgi:nucleotide-binding universal stress UspA family protein